MAPAALFITRHQSIQIKLEEVRKDSTEMNEWEPVVFPRLISSVSVPENTEEVSNFLSLQAIRSQIFKISNAKNKRKADREIELILNQLICNKNAQKEEV